MVPGPLTWTDNPAWRREEVTSVHWESNAHEKATYALKKVLAEDQAVAGPLHDQSSENDEVPNQVFQQGEEQGVLITAASQG